MANLTREQRAWLTSLGKLVGDAPVADDGPAEDRKGQRGDRDGGDIKSLAPDLPVKGLFDLEVPLVNSRISIKNRSNVALHLAGQATLENIQASFTKPPPFDIGGPGDDDFTVTNQSKIFGVPRAGGTGGQVTYELVDDEKKAQLFLKWERGAIPDRNTVQRVTPDDGRFEIKGLISGDDFQFELKRKGGVTPPPNPNPNPQPQPQPQPGPADLIASSCLIQVTNQTKQKLIFKDAKHERGDFMVRPLPTIDPDGVDGAIVSIETPRAPDEGCKGFIEYKIGEPPLAVLRVDWDNPEGAKNTCEAKVVPPSPTLEATAVIGQGDENVRVNFVVRETGGGEPPVPPNPLPVPVPPKPVDAPKTRQPTLRQGDKSPDGWVEYLQQRLNDLNKAGLKVDGDFGKATLKAVHDFQKARGLQDDGTVGNQTWAALRDATPENPSTDGRKPHTFVQKGPQARWNDEKERAIYLTSLDEMLLFLVSVGTTPIDSFSVEVTVTAPGMPAATKSFPIGKPDKETGTGSGSFHSLKMNQFRKTFPSKSPAAKITDYRIVAKLPAELSGEGWTGDIVEG